VYVLVQYSLNTSLPRNKFKDEVYKLVSYEAIKKNKTLFDVLPSDSKEVVEEKPLDEEQ
jgi:hypothetical protein